MVAVVDPLSPSAVAELERPLTEADFWRLPDDGNRYEILGGELLVAPPPTVDHQSVSVYLSVAIYHAIEIPRIGWVRTAPIGVRLSPSDIVQPDLIVLTREDARRPTGKIVEDRPAIVMEILSPSNRRDDRVRKRAQFQLIGIGEYWIIDPLHRTVEVLVLDQGEYVLQENVDGVAASEVVPSIEIDVAHLFSGEPFDPAFPNRP